MAKVSTIQYCLKVGHSSAIDDGNTIFTNKDSNSKILQQNSPIFEIIHMTCFCKKYIYGENIVLYEVDLSDERMCKIRHGFHL